MSNDRVLDNAEGAAMNGRQRRQLVEEIATELNLPGTATHQQVSRRLCAVMSRRLGHRIEVRFARLGQLTGATAVLRDGTYLVICANTPSWYHRLQIMLHEFAHLLLGHEHSTLTVDDGLRRYLPNLLPRMARIIAGRTRCGAAEEREAEELADALLARLTEPTTRADPTPTDIAGHVLRLAETMEHGRGRRTT